MLIIPAIDLRNGQCVRLTQGRKEATTIYDSDPVALAKGFQEAGARMLHVVDLDGAFAEPNSRNRQMLGEIIRATDVPVQFGGGLRAIQDVKTVVELGVTRIVIGTVAVESPDTLKSLVRLFGGDRIVVGIDARDGQVVTRGWEREAKLPALELARRVAALGVRRVIYTDVSRDGTLAGVNIEQTCKLARESGLKITASGGISSLEDIRRLRNVSHFGIDSVIIGKALYEGRFTLKEALQGKDEG